MKKIVSTITGTVAAAIMLTACGSSNPVARSTRTPTPSSTLPAWTSSYTPAQIRDYDAALAAFEAIQAREAPIWANPSHFTVAQVGTIFRGDWSNTSRPLHQFASYLSNGIRVLGRPEVISSRLGAVVTNSGGSGLEQMTIRQCVDGSQIKASQRGKPLSTARSKRGVREIEIFKTARGQYLLFQIGQGAGSC